MFPSYVGMLIVAPGVLAAGYGILWSLGRVSDRMANDAQLEAERSQRLINLIVENDRLKTENDHLNGWEPWEPADAVARDSE